MKLSVCMATYNGEKFIQATLESILPQLKDQDEVVIVDDASSDNTVAIIKSLKEPRIRMVENRQNKGAAGTFFKAIDLAEGEIILLADQDDLWKENKAEFVRDYFSSNECDLLVHNAEISLEGEILPYSLFEKLKSGPGFWKNLARNTFTGCCLVMKKEMKEVVLPKIQIGGAFFHDQYIGLMSELFSRKIRFSEKSFIIWLRHEKNKSVLERRKSFFKIMLERFLVLLNILVNSFLIMMPK